jgi:hypothetical protein
MSLFITRRSDLTREQFNDYWLNKYWLIFRLFPNLEITLAEGEYKDVSQIDHVLLAHKGIERSDLQINITVDGVRAKALGFAKLAHKRSGSASSLTLRNNNGAVLLSQVVSQVARTDFDIVAVLSPSPFSEDLIEALETVCGPYNKSLLSHSIR